jgi:hypothetical protein
MNRLSDIRVIEDIDGNGLPFSESQDWPRRGSVIAHRFYDFAWSYRQGYRRDAKRNIRLIRGLIVGIW